MPIRVYSWREDLLKSKGKTDHYLTGSDTKLKILSGIMPSGDIGEEQN